MMRRALATVAVVVAVAGCGGGSASGGGGGITQAQADHCNQVLAATRPILSAMSEPADPAARVTNAQSLNGAAEKVAVVYRQESGPIKDASQSIGVVLVRTSQDLLAKQDLTADQTQLLTSIKALNTACHIKSQ